MSNLAERATRITAPLVIHEFRYSMYSMFVLVKNSGSLSPLVVCIHEHLGYKGLARSDQIADTTQGLFLRLVINLEQNPTNRANTLHVKDR